MAKPKMPYPVPGFKRCTVCQEEKRLEDFHPEPRVTSGTTARCRGCILEANRAYYKKHPERIKAARTKYIAKYPERVREAQNFSRRRLALERRERRIAEGKPLLEPRETDEGRRCSSCRRRKPKDQFPPNAGHYDGLPCYCRECVNRKARESTKKPSVRSYRRRYMKGYDLKKNYGLTMEAFNALVAKQDGKCAICFDELKLGTGGCGVDHDHTTGVVRGLLCRLCNVGIGHFRERPDLLTRAIEYLRSQPCLPSD
jgi:Recombination endonuclease VII